MAPPKFPTLVTASMESQPETSPLRQIYAEDTYPGGGYYPSPFGRTKYWIIGPEGGSKVVLIHGISAPALVYKNVVNALVREGFQVLVYDLYGRGYSEAPECPQDANLYILQLALLLQYVKWDAVDVVGFSMGGAIAAAFSATFPHLVKEHVAFLAAAGLMELVPSAASQVVPSQGVSGHAAVTNPPAPEARPEIVAKVNELTAKFRNLQFELLPGALRVVQGSRSDGVLSELQWAFESLGKSDKRFLIIHGTADTIVPYTEAHKIKKYIPQAKLVPIEGASHYLPLEDGAWEPLVESLVPFLTNTEGRRSQR